MSEPEGRWTQYRVFAEARLNFSRQFMQVVAVMLTLVLAALAVFRDAPETWRSWGLVGTGLALMQTSFIAHRLRRTEVQYERLLHEIELAAGALVQPRSGRFGAKTSVVASLFLAGAGAAAAGLLALSA